MNTDPSTPVELDAEATAPADTATDAPEPAGGAIDLVKGAPDDFTEIVLRVGPGGGRRQRFFGRLLGEARQYNKSGFEVVRVYLSRKGKFVIHRRDVDWKDYARSADWNDWTSWRDLFGFAAGQQDWGDYTVEVVNTFVELSGRIPERIYRTVADVAAHPSVQDLEI
ncbi:MULTISPECIES: EXLDI protein [unclassified Nocardia]|uniref:EXLDI protein n=1 Tax=unclassified Nocardia TaxID=2637762 RepID=UPI001CE49026|nr:MULTISPECIES: EXLDI protein [unclassified Nocardia]